MISSITEAKLSSKEKALSMIEHYPRIVNKNPEILKLLKIEETKQELRFDFIIMFMIILSVILVVIETMNELESYSKLFLTLDGIFSTFFLIEYILRIWTSDINLEYNTYSNKYHKSSRLKARFNYMTSFMGIIDLLSFLPFLFVILHIFILPLELSTLRIIRLFRLFRIFELVHYNKSLKKIIRVFKAKMSDLLLSIFTIIMLLIISATLMYLVESQVQPDKFSSIPQSFWWALATITTIGYGDVYPITPLGQILTGFIALLGLLLISVPTGIVSAGFMEYDTKKLINYEKKKYQIHRVKRVKKRSK